MITQSTEKNSKLEENREDSADGQYDSNLDITARNIAVIIPCYNEAAACSRT
jgi:hypothetical protein